MRGKPYRNMKAYTSKGWLLRLVRLAGFVPIAEAEAIARAGLYDAARAQGERDRALRKARALTVLASDMMSVFSDKDAIVTEERADAWRKRLRRFSEPNDQGKPAS